MAVITTAITGAAGVALAGCLWQISTRLRSLESQRNETPSVPESPRPGRRGSKPMLGALYTEQPASPLSSLTSLPGGAWLGAALGLGIVAVGLSGFAPARATPMAPAPDSTLMMLQSRVDSLGRVVAGLRDSVRMVSVPSQAVRPAETSHQSSRKAKPTGTVLPAPPAP